jgi:hypothetical protein
MVSPPARRPADASILRPFPIASGRRFRHAGRMATPKFKSFSLPLEVRVRISRRGGRVSYRYSELMPPEVDADATWQLLLSVSRPLQARFTRRGRWITMSVTDCELDRLSAFMIGEFQGWATSPEAQRFIREVLHCCNQAAAGEEMTLPGVS